MSQHHQKILMRSIEERIRHIDMALENLAHIGTYDRDDFYFDEPELREKFVMASESLKELRAYLNDTLTTMQNRGR